MPSSISSSEAAPVRSKGRLTKATWVFLACAVVVYVIVDSAALLELSTISTINRRIFSERNAARTVQPARSGGKTVLFTGNSLLLEGVDFPRLARELRPQFEATRYVIEATAYYDWYYCLRGLFRRGARPDYVVVCLSPPHLMSNGINGDFSARFMFDFPDIWPVSRATHSSLTTTTSLYAAHFSTFYGVRAQLRSALIGKVIHRIPEMWQHSVFVKAVVPPDQEVLPIFTERLEGLKTLCESNGVHLIYLVPPTAQGGDNAILEAGKRLGVPVMRPIPNYSLPEEYYQDGLHLNTRGAALFTTLIENEMRQIAN